MDLGTYALNARNLAQQRVYAAAQKSAASSIGSCSDDEHEYSSSEENGDAIKRTKMTNEERLIRCRERNRVHARNTRERKKCLMDGLQSRIQQLVDEKKRLSSSKSESNVASILMTLATGLDRQPSDGSDRSTTTTTTTSKTSMLINQLESDEDIAPMIESLKTQVGCKCEC